MGWAGFVRVWLNLHFPYFFTLAFALCVRASHLFSSTHSPYTFHHTIINSSLSFSHTTIPFFISSTLFATFSYFFVLLLLGKSAPSYVLLFGGYGVSWNYGREPSDFQDVSSQATIRVEGYETRTGKFGGSSSNGYVEVNSHIFSWIDGAMNFGWGFLFYLVTF
ncbi:uncharacterized protein LOC141601028 [Silene latifolia]|uniref:uncharacterized protein LOC141601028 n=1 Tax=Silene latifolia TaxID=37657 RepID=UPI003D770928